MNAAQTAGGHDIDAHVASDGNGAGYGRGSMQSAGHHGTEITSGGLRH